MNFAYIAAAKKKKEIFAHTFLYRITILIIVTFTIISRK